MIRYTKGGNRLISDIIGSENSCDLQAGGVRPVWVEVNIPPSAKPGVYKGKIVVSAESGSPVSVPVVLEVAPESLPAPANCRFTWTFGSIRRPWRAGMMWNRGPRNISR